MIGWLFREFGGALVVLGAAPVGTPGSAFVASGHSPFFSNTATIGNYEVRVMKFFIFHNLTKGLT